MSEKPTVGYRMPFYGPCLLSLSQDGRIVNWYGKHGEAVKKAVKRRHVLLTDGNLIIIQEKPKCKPHHKRFKSWFNNKRREMLNKYLKRV